MPSLAPPRLPRPLVAAFVAYVVLLSVAAVVQLRAEPAAPRSQDRPNIVLVTTDDQRLDEMQFLPNAQRLLGEEGLTFENALTPHPLCCPARAELMTGQLAQNNGVRGNFPPQGGYDAFDNQQHVGVWLQEAGYTTAFLGKMLNGYSKNDGRVPGWDIFNATSHGFADYYDFVQYDEDGPVQVEGYYTDYVGEKAVEYVDRLAESDDPFFMWVSHFAPHPARERDTCKSETCGLVPPRPSPAQREEQRRTGELPHQEQADALARSIIDSPSFNEADVSDKQALVRRQGSFSEGKVVRSARGRAAALDALDQTLEPLVEQLRAVGRARQHLHRPGHRQRLPDGRAPLVRQDPALRGERADPAAGARARDRARHHHRGHRHDRRPGADLPRHRRRRGRGERSTAGRCWTCGAARRPRSCTRAACWCRAGRSGPRPPTPAGSTAASAPTATRGCASTTASSRCTTATATRTRWSRSPAVPGTPPSRPS